MTLGSALFEIKEDGKVETVNTQNGTWFNK